MNPSPQEAVATALEQAKTEETPKPPIGSPPANAIKEAYERWEELLDVNRAHQETIKEHETTITKLSLSVDGEKAKAARLQRERDAYQTYAVGLQTRLTAIKEQIAAAEQATLEWMKKAQEEQNGKHEEK